MKPIDHRESLSATDDYWSQTRQPLVCLLFLLPLLAVYEFGVLALSGSAADGVRNGADVWLRSGLQELGFAQPFVLPAVVIGGLLVWHFEGRYPRRISIDTLPGMLAESILFAFVLAGIAQAGETMFQTLHIPRTLAISETRTAVALTFVGAGIYEETMFRLCLLPGCIGLFRLSRLSPGWSIFLAVLATSLAFSLAHHVGQPADTFPLFPFAFRTIAGIVFALLFLYRGFGITVGCHAGYDLLVGVVFR